MLAAARSKLDHLGNVNSLKHQTALIIIILSESHRLNIKSFVPRILTFLPFEEI